MKILSLFFAFTFSITLLQAQTYSDAMKPFFGYSSGNPMSIAIGQATVAAGQVLPDIGNNPANLGTQRFRSLSLGYCSADFNGNTESMSQNGISNLQFIFPFPVYQGSLVAAAGFNREHEYGLNFADSDFSLREEGSMNSYYLALSVEYMKNLYIGMDINFLRGYNEYFEQDADVTYLIQPDYRGFQLGLGILQRVNPYLNLAFSVDFPSSIAVDEVYTESHPDWNDSWNYEYAMNQAPVFRAGTAFFIPLVNIFYEAEYRDWGNLNFSSDMEDDKGLDADIAINREIEENLKATLSHHLGAALHPPILPLHLYAGYQIIPEPHSDIVRNSMSFGLSWLFQQQLSLNYSFQQQQWDYEGNTEKWSQSSLSLNLHF